MADNKRKVPATAEPSRRRPPVCLNSDRNFDDLAPRFARNIYGGLKGELRLAVLRQDFLEFIPHALQTQSGDTPPLRVLDAGGGQGQFGLQLAACGHAVTLCDISAQMLHLARQQAQEDGLVNVDFVHASIQQISQEIFNGQRAPFDLVLCHAVLEWVADQQGLMTALQALVRDGGHLSLTFYNRHGLVLKNLLRGKRSPVLDEEFTPSAGSLTPTRPLDPLQVLAWLTPAQGYSPWQILCRSGMRVFHDLLLTDEGRAMPADKLLALELELCRQDPWRMVARYQHILAQRLCPEGQTG